LLVSTTAWAETPAKEAADLVIQAQDDFDERFYAQAAGKLERAYALSPEPDVLLKLVEVYDRWEGHCPDISATFERYFEACPDCASLATAQRRAKELAQRCQAPVTFKTKPSGASVRIDGRTAGRTPLTVKLAAGRHTFAASLRGFSAHQGTLQLEAGEEQVVEVDLLRASGDVGELLFENIPRHTQVRVDGELVEGPGLASFYCDPGQRQVEISHVSGRVGLLNLIVERGDRVRVDVGRALGAVPDIPDEPAPGARGTRDGQPVAWGPIIMAVGAAAVGAGVFFGSKAGVAENQRDLARATAAWPDAPSMRQEIVYQYDEAKSNALRANVS